MPTDRDRVGYAFDIACSECTAIVWEMQEGIAITNNYANIWPCGAEGVKNWPGRRNRLPHPVCKPLDSKEGGADGFVCRARKPIFHSFSARLYPFPRRRNRPNIRPIRASLILSSVVFGATCKNRSLACNVHYSG